jgi:hypothetical protein
LRRLASPIFAFVLVSPLVPACADDVPQGTDSMSASEGSSGSGSTSSGSTSTTTNSGTGTGTGEPTTDPTTPTTDPTNPTTDATSTTTTTTETTGSTGTTGEPVTCCEPQPGPSCGDPAIEACVCATDPTCCEQAWTEECALLVNKLECGSCPIAEGPCCAAGQGPGCLEDPVQDCVCAQLPDCCSTLWGDECVAAVDLLGCGMCGEPPPKGECCQSHMDGGCIDPEVEQCVCGLAPDCCDVWTEECVQIVELGGCGMCGGGDKGECCVANLEPGCTTPEVEACVCAQDPFCCEEQWDGQCAAEVEALGCGMCGGMGGDCCSPGDGPGCVDPQIEQCVCAAAPSCCNDKWTDACAALVEPLQCGMCGGMGNTGCCEVHETPSCDDQTIADCVCAQDDFCCNFEWDGLCVAEVEMFGCGMCN